MLVALCALTLSLTGLALADGGDGGGPGDQKGLRAHLAGPAIKGEKPEGSAKSSSNNGQKRFTVEVQDVNLADGAMLAVILVHEGNRMRVGDLTLSMGTAELELRSRDGDQVPQVQAGDTVLVMHGKTHVLAGVFL
jgi:hypothetical protein